MMLSSIPTTLLFFIIALTIHCPRPSFASIGYSYYGTNGPLDWSDLENDWKACGANEFQSPINFDSSWRPNNSYRPEFSLLSVPPQQAFFNGHTFQISVANSNISSQFNGSKYKFQQYHLHLPSEHFFDGKYAEMEMHMLHEASDGDYLVLAILFDLTSSKSDPFLSQSIANLGSISGKPSNTNTTTDNLDLSTIAHVFNSSDIHRYGGSLTVPPCSPVTWIVARNMLPVNLDDYKALKSLIGFNARPIQNNPGEPNLIQLACKWPGNSSLSTTL